VGFGVGLSLDKDTEVIVHKDKGVPSSKVVDVIDRATAAGLTKFTLE
jgi:biopolymer transport protein ExbD